ncbi:hypothetical protein Egran_05144 [Elaphomyces granulatus]|uniref:Uncharacterized protein n=1 Tax=Elaphomyces granulatus TaxID=519963 RepID=A0A232LSF1_9EURO|nr:hypothetical protein Egran_05144 [Elaphomyces granulatus]
MSAATAVDKGQTGILHRYSDGLVAFEYASGTNPRSKPHSLLFIGGLGDGFFTVRFVADLVVALESTSWSFFSVLLSSSYAGWGLGSLGKDIEEIAKCVQYVRNYKQPQQGELSEVGKVVIMGHSTGSQDVLHYLYSPNPLPRNPQSDSCLQHLLRPVVDGAILQAPVSDREGLRVVLQSGTATDSPAVLAGIYTQLVDIAKRTCSDGGSVDVLLPLSLTSRLGYPADTAISCRRFLSLVSPDSPEHPSEDDLFSSDLTDDRLQETFGMVASRGLLRSKLLVLYSGRDQFAPEWVDKASLLQRWKNATDNNSKEQVWDAKYSGVISEASHSLIGDEEEEPRRDLVARVMAYFRNVEKCS